MKSLPVRPLRIVVMGTGPFAVPMFQSLLESPHDVRALVTRPSRTTAGRRPPVNPMRDAAGTAGVPVLDPERVNAADAVAGIVAHMPDLLVVCDYGQILSPAVLASAGYGGINLHGSLLPRHRGAAPVQWAILEGDEVTGISVIQMTPELDAGRVLVTRETAVFPGETAPELEGRLAALGGEAVLEAIDRLVSAGPGVAVGTPQDDVRATRAPRLAKADGLVDWTWPAHRIERMRRALEPWPRTASFLRAGGDRPPLRVVLEDVSVVPGAASASGREEAAPGSILAAEGDALVVACGGGSRLAIRRLVPEGRRAMSAADFLRGHVLLGQARFG